MAKIRSAKKSKKSSTAAFKASETPETLLASAATLLQTSQPDQALNLAARALRLLQSKGKTPQARLPALNLLGEISVELGEIDAARNHFEEAAELDPDGSISEAVGGGAEKFLWLAQLCEEGGAVSVSWFEKGIIAIRREIGMLEDAANQVGNGAGSNLVAAIEEKKTRLANALCGVIEVYMTDLSWEEDAESRCEALITEALMVAPQSSEPLQTLASIRISQLKVDDAKAALRRSMELWTDLPPDDPRVPDFATRISLTRLLMEAEMEDEALEVLERLVQEDDQSVEAWYLGGWGLHMIAEKRRTRGNGAGAETDGDEAANTFTASRKWLKNSLKLYEALEYEDDRLRDHALELVEGLDKVLGPEAGDEEDDADDVWEDADEEEDEEMEGT